MYLNKKIFFAVLQWVLLCTGSQNEKSIWDYDNWHTTFISSHYSRVPYRELSKVWLYESARVKPENRSLVNVFDGYRHILHSQTDSIQIWAKGSVQYTLTYNKGKPTAFIDRFADETYWEYDSSGLLVKQRKVWRSGKQGGTLNFTDINFTYDSKGKMISSTTNDAFKRRTDFAYDAQGRVTEVITWKRKSPDSDTFVKSEGWMYTYNQDTITSVALVYGDSTPEPQVYLRNKEVISEGMMKRRESLYIRNGVSKTNSLTEYTNEGDSVLWENDFRILPTRDTIHDRTAKSVFNASGQLERRESNSYGRDEVYTVSANSYTATGQLESTVVTEKRNENPTITKSRVLYFYDTSGTPQKVQYFVRKRNNLVLYKEFSFKVYYSGK